MVLVYVDFKKQKRCKRLKIRNLFSITVSKIVMVLFNFDVKINVIMGIDSFFNSIKQKLFSAWNWTQVTTKVYF